MKVKIIMLMSVLLFGCTSVNTTQTVIPPDDHMQILAVQMMLQKDGYNIGTADGQEGPDTLAAIKDFQTKNSLPVTGELDETTVTILRNTIPSN